MSVLYSVCRKCGTKFVVTRVDKCPKCRTYHTEYNKLELEK